MMSERDYQRFASSLIPNIEPDRVLGVRLPLLRKLAGELAREDWSGYLRDAWDGYFEETMLQGMVLGRVRAPLSKLEPYLRRFVPKIDNWSVCDSFCTGLKTARQEPEKMWEILETYLNSRQAYEVRFGVVMILKYYVNESYMERAFAWFDRIEHPDYYVKMAVAWAVSVYYPAYPQQTRAYLRDNCLDDFTYHKAIQKIRESLQVSKEEKEELKQWKRQG